MRRHEAPRRRDRVLGHALRVQRGHAVADGAGEVAAGAMPSIGV